MIASWQENYDKPRQCVEKHRHQSADKGLYSQGCGFPSGPVRLWELDCKEDRGPKNWCLRIVVLEKTLATSLDSKEIKPVNLKGNQPWIVIGRLTLKLWYFGDWCKQPTHWKSPRCWETLWVEEEGVWGWDSWMASPMQWTWTWANFRRQWGTEA